MTLHTASGSLPRHLYVKVDGSFIGTDDWQDAVWFGLHSHPGRAWGCTIILANGAVFRNLPPHAIAFCDDPPVWLLSQSQLWDCYGSQFSIHIYTYLDGLNAIARIDGVDVPCNYLFTAIPLNDGFTQEPTQDKEFMFLKTTDGRLTIQPTNRVRFIEDSFTDRYDPNWPKLEVQAQVYSRERF